MFHGLMNNLLLNIHRFVNISLLRRLGVSVGQRLIPRMSIYGLWFSTCLSSEKSQLQLPLWTELAAGVRVETVNIPYTYANS
jgi:hypothetical protein